jgi:hypothetical protein
MSQPRHRGRQASPGQAASLSGRPTRVRSGRGGRVPAPAHGAPERGGGPLRRSRTGTGRARARDTEPARRLIPATRWRCRRRAAGGGPLGRAAGRAGPAAGGQHRPQGTKPGPAASSRGHQRGPEGTGAGTSARRADPPGGRARAGAERQQVRELHDGLLADLRRVHGEISGLLARTDTPSTPGTDRRDPEPKAVSARNGKADRPAGPGTVAQHQ